MNFFLFILFGHNSMTSTQSILSASNSESTCSTSESIPLLVLLIVIVVGAAVTNILICAAFSMVHVLRKPHYYLVVSLAVTDLCVAMLVSIENYLCGKSNKLKRVILCSFEFSNCRWFRQWCTQCVMSGFSVSWLATYGSFSISWLLQPPYWTYVRLHSIDIGQ